MSIILSLGMSLFNLVKPYNCISEAERKQERQFKIINFKIMYVFIILLLKNKLYKLIKTRNTIIGK